MPLSLNTKKFKIKIKNSILEVVIAPKQAAKKITVNASEKEQDALDCVDAKIVKINT